MARPARVRSSRISNAAKMAGTSMQRERLLPGVDTRSYTAARNIRRISYQPKTLLDFGFSGKPGFQAFREVRPVWPERILSGHVTGPSYKKVRPPRIARSGPASSGSSMASSATDSRPAQQDVAAVRSGNRTGSRHSVRRYE
jgi:hypothetical protein